MEGKRSFYVKTNDPYLPEDLNPFGVENSYTLVWPTKGMISKEAEKELIQQVFGDSTAHSANEAAQRWLNNLWLFEDTKALEAKMVDSVSGQSPYTYAHLNNSIEKNENLVTFIIRGHEDRTEKEAAHEQLLVARHRTKTGDMA